jgi:hypothetical protein
MKMTTKKFVSLTDHLKKLPDHKFIFNDEELKKYKKELQEMDL